MSAVERIILNFLRDHQMPEKVQILCDTEEAARSYKMAYNFWFAGTKEERMDTD